jgi:hypothetical protein
MDSLARRQQVRGNATQPDSWQEVSQQNARQLARDQQFAPPNPPTNFSADQYAAAQQPDHSSASRPVSEGWYAKRRDQAQTVLHASPAAAPQQAQNQSFSIPSPPTRAMTPQAASPTGSFSRPVGPSASPPGDRRVLLEWSRGSDAGVPAAQGALTGVAMRDDGPLRR